MTCFIIIETSGSNEKLTDRRPSETLELPEDVAGGGSVERLVRR